MKPWNASLASDLGVFLAEHGVDMPRAWHLHCRQQSSKGNHDNRLRTFMAFLIAEYPVEVAKWRILGGK
jgi:hypothetical protein